MRITLEIGNKWHLWREINGGRIVVVLVKGGINLSTENTPAIL